MCAEEMSGRVSPFLRWPLLMEKGESCCQPLALLPWGNNSQLHLLLDLACVPAVKLSAGEVLGEMVV